MMMVLDPKILNHPLSASYSMPTQSFSSGTSPRNPTPTQGLSSGEDRARRTSGSFLSPVSFTTNRLPSATSLSPMESAAVLDRDQNPSRILSPGGGDVVALGNAVGIALTISRASCPGSIADPVACGVTVGVGAGVGMPTFMLSATFAPGRRFRVPTLHPVAAASAKKTTERLARIMDFISMFSFQGEKARIGRCVLHNHTPMEAALSMSNYSYSA